MKNKVIIGLAILILGTGIIAAFSALNKNNDTKTSESTTNQVQQEAQQVSPTQMPNVGPSQQSPILSPVISPAAGQTFEIRGAITSVSGNTFMVGGSTITINPAKVVNFQQTTGVTVGNQVKVEGIIENGILFAREIKPLAEDNSGKN